MLLEVDIFFLDIMIQAQILPFRQFYKIQTDIMEQMILVKLEQVKNELLLSQTEMSSGTLQEMCGSM